MSSWSRGHGDTVTGDYTRWLLAREPKALSLLGPENALPHDYVCPQAHRTRIPAELYSTAYIAERAAAYLGEHAGDDEPFFLMVSFPDPHHPFNPPGKYWDMYRPEQFAVPEAFRRNDWTPPAHVQAVIDARGEGRRQPQRHALDRHDAARSAGGPSADLRHDRLHRRRHRRRAGVRWAAAAKPATRW